MRSPEWRTAIERVQSIAFSVLIVRTRQLTARIIAFRARKVRSRAHNRNARWTWPVCTNRRKPTPPRRAKRTFGALLSSSNVVIDSANRRPPMHEVGSTPDHTCATALRLGSPPPHLHRNLLTDVDAAALFVEKLHSELQHVAHVRTHREPAE